MSEVWCPEEAPIYRWHKLLEFKIHVLWDMRQAFRRDVVHLLHKPVTLLLRPNTPQPGHSLPILAYPLIISQLLMPGIHLLYVFS
jgi:hypothetical protein